jgi:hypothetical protein
MSAITLLDAVLVLALLGCAPSAASLPWSSTTLTSAAVSTTDLDDAQIASIASEMVASQRVLAALARSQADSPAVRALGHRFVEDTSTPLVSGPASRAAPASALEDELVRRDVATELRLARFGGSSFDEAFVAADTAVIEGNVLLLERTLLPRASAPALKARLVRVASMLARQLAALRAESSSARAH